MICATLNKNCHRMNYSLLVCLMLLFPAVLKAQDIPLYTFVNEKIDSGRTFSFSSLMYMTSWDYDDPEAITMPDVTIPEGYKGYGRKGPISYATLLIKDDRKRALQMLNIAETDKVFIYDYNVDILLQFTVNELNLVSIWDIYGSNEYRDYNYQIGFEFDEAILKGIQLPYCLLYIGDESPFMRGKLKPMIWQEVSNDSLPYFAQSERDSTRQIGSFPTTSFKFESEGMVFFVQNIAMKEVYSASRLVVFDSENQKLILQKTEYYHMFTSSFPLNYKTVMYGDQINQWMGQLFKHRPSVIFGFQDVSFGCRTIYFLDQSFPPIEILCHEW